MDARQKKIAERHLKKIKELSLTKIIRSHFIIGLEFEDKKGNCYAIDALSRCVINSGNEIIVDSETMYDPAPGVKEREDSDYGVLECVFDLQVRDFAQNMPISVIGITLSDTGVITLDLNGKYLLKILPWLDNPYEAWRIFDVKKNKKHCVYYGNGTVKVQ